MKKLLKKKGFTLVEVLIVVVILGILAALILPKLLAQPNKARVAEAIQWLGAINRAQESHKDSVSATVYVVAVCDATATGGTAASAYDGDTNWRLIGLGPCKGSLFTYSCTTTSCTATPDSTTFPNAPASSTVTMTLGPGNKATCTGSFSC